MAEVFELSASFKIDTSGYKQEIDKLREEMKAIQREFDAIAISPTFDGGRFRDELNRARQEASSATDEIAQLKDEIARLQQTANSGSGSGESADTGITGFLKKLNIIGDIASGTFLSNIATSAINGVIDGITGSLSESIDLASDLVEVQNVVDVTFGKSAETVNQWATEALNAYGITETKAKQYSSTLGAMLKSMGIADDQVTKMSLDMAGLAADMASFYNMDHDTAFEKIRSGISGETEPLKALGINMSVANLQAFALEQGVTKAFDKMTQAEQATLRYQYLLEATADAQGDFARTGDSYSNEMRKLQTNLDRIKTEWGKGLLGVVTPAISLLNKALSDKSYQQTEAEKIMSEQKKSLFDSEVAYQRSLNILNAMHNMEAEGGSAVKSTDEWRAALEALKEVMPGLAQYVDLTTDAITGNTGAIDKYVDSLHNVTNADAFETTVTKAKSAKESKEAEIADIDAQIAVIDKRLQSSDENVKAVYKDAVEKAYQNLKSKFSGSALDLYFSSDSFDQFNAGDFFHASDYARLNLAMQNGATSAQKAALSELKQAVKKYNNPDADLQAQKEELIKQREEETASLVELTAAYERATAERDNYYNTPEGQKGKLQLDFDKAVQSEKDALNDLINAYKTANTIRADTLDKMQKQYSGVATQFGFLATHTKSDMEKLISTTYSEENVMGWWGTNADTLNNYNASLQEAQALGVDKGILQGLLTYSTENDAILARVLAIANDPEKLAELNAKYKKSKDAEQSMAQTATEIALANNEDYLNAKQAVQDYYQLFDQSDYITATMADNNAAALVGIDAFTKELNGKIAEIAPILKALYGIDITTRLGAYHDYTDPHAADKYAERDINDLKAQAKRRRQNTSSESKAVEPSSDNKSFDAVTSAAVTLVGTVSTAAPAFDSVTAAATSAATALDNLTSSATQSDETQPPTAPDAGNWSHILRAAAIEAKSAATSQVQFLAIDAAKSTSSLFSSTVDSVYDFVEKIYPALQEYAIVAKEAKAEEDAKWKTSPLLIQGENTIAAVKAAIEAAEREKQSGVQFVPNTYIGAPDAEQPKEPEVIPQVSTDMPGIKNAAIGGRSAFGKTISRIDWAGLASMSAELAAITDPEILDNYKRSVEEEFFGENGANRVAEIRRMTDEAFESGLSSAPNIFSDGGILEVRVINTDEMNGAPMTIENTFTVDGAAIATVISPRVNSRLGSEMRTNLMSRVNGV